jgi:hypothetical protein
MLKPNVLMSFSDADRQYLVQMRRSSFQIFAACTISGMNLSMEGTLLVSRQALPFCGTLYHLGLV